MKRLLVLLGPLFFPLLLSGLPILGIYIRDAREVQRQESRYQEAWEDKARLLTEEIRAGYLFETQIRQMAQGMKRWFARITDADFKFSGAVLEKLIKKHFAAGHLVPGTKIFGFSRNRNGGLEPLSGSFLEARSSRLLGGLIARCLDRETVSQSELEQLNRRVRSFFGDNLGFELLAGTQRGKVFPAVFGGRVSFVFWDAIENSRGPIGAFLMVFPLSAQQTTKPLEYVLTVVCRRYPGMVPILVPLPGESARFSPVFPQSRRIGEGMKRFVRRLSGLSYQARDKILPARTRTALHPKVWARREFLMAENGHEAIVLGGPRKRGAGGNRGGFLFLILVIGTALLYLMFRVWSLGRVPNLSVRGWMMSFFLFLAVVAMGSLHGFGTWYIETAVERKRDDELQKLNERLQGFDSGVTQVLEDHDHVLRDIMARKEWMRLFVPNSGFASESGSPAAVIPPKPTPEANRQWQKLVSQLASRSFPIYLETCLGYSFLPTRSDWYFTTQKSERKVLGHLEFYRSFMNLCAAGFQGMESLAQVGSSTRAPGGLGKLVEASAAPSTYVHYFSMRRRSSVMDSSEERCITFHDFFSSQARLIGGAVLMADLDKSFSGYLIGVMERLALGGCRDHFAVARQSFGSFDLIYPRKEKFWNSHVGRKLKRVIDIAFEVGGERVVFERSHLFMAIPCQSISGFVLAGTVSLQAILVWEQQALSLLSFFLSGALVLTLLLGMATARYLLVPLAEVAHGLEEVGKGNLAIRLGQTSNDELGDMCGAFDRMIRGIEERRELGRFVSGQLDALVGKSTGADDLSPRRRTAALLVSDLRSFTTLSESYSAREIVAMLNHHHQAMSEAVRGCGGFVELFIGDAIVAFFPDAGDGEGCRSALRAAREMMSRHLSLQEERRLSSRFTYEIGIGIDYGEVLSGQVGSGDRREYVILGRVRAYAEKLEGFSRHGTLTRIVCSPEAVKQLPAQTFRPLSQGEGLELEQLAAET
jgi:class 3 adenylate cyclase